MVTPSLSWGCGCDGGAVSMRVVDCAASQCSVSTAASPDCEKVRASAGSAFVRFDMLHHRPSTLNGSILDVRTQRKGIFWARPQICSMLNSWGQPSGRDGQPIHAYAFVYMSQFPWFGEVLAALVARQDLNRAQVRAVLGEMMAGRCGEAEAAAFLVALRMKGETAEEIAAAAEVLREHMVRWEPGCECVLDTCGTGGDGTGTFNISTAAAFVVAAAGVPVVKHGNRSVSSRSGSADVLAALSVCVEGDGAFGRRCLQRAGLAFCFAPHFHPALRH